MILGSIYRNLVLLSPRIEVIIRCLYWSNVSILKRFRFLSKENEQIHKKESINFDKILSYLKKNGVKKDDIMVIHSSFDALKGSGLSAEQVIEKLYELVNEGGTLAMPAIRSFDEENTYADYLDYYMDDVSQNFTTVYNVYHSPISAGLLPFTLMRYDEAEVSDFPLNPLTALGTHAEQMMIHNTEGEFPSAHGPNSAWAYCARHNAWNIGLGVDIKDYLTIFHVAQEVPEWPVRNWYFERNFIIKRGKRETPIRIRERRHLWTKFFAETNFYNDLIHAGILKTALIDGVPIYMTRSRELFEFIDKHKNPTYPYYIPKKYIKQKWK